MKVVSYRVYQLTLTKEQAEQLEEICKYILCKLTDEKYYLHRSRAVQLLAELYENQFEDVCILSLPEGMARDVFNYIHEIVIRQDAPLFAKEFEISILRAFTLEQWQDIQGGGWKV